jgi:transposase InsO family protein
MEHRIVHASCLVCTTTSLPTPCREPTAAHKAIFNWIEDWYNTRRRNSTLDYLSPAAYEARINQQPDLRQVA